MLRQPNPASKRSIARQYEVSEAAIRKVWLNREKVDSSFLIIWCELNWDANLNGCALKREVTVQTIYDMLIEKKSSR